MTEVEVEKFEITDYDLENEFNPNRRRFRLTKNQQIYGINGEAELPTDADYHTDDEQNDSDWEECETGEIPLVLCLFCEQTFRTPDETFMHCRSVHGFDVTETKHKYKLDCFSYIRLINYLRKNKPSPVALLEDVDLSAALTNDDYMKPALENDELLMFDIEGVEETEFMPATDYQKLLQEFRDADIKLKETEEQLQVATMQIEKMRGVIHRCLETESQKSCCSHSPSMSYEDDDDGYFGTYAHFGIHHEMLQDRIRTESYKNAILFNPELFHGKAVLDVGCGTGILSMFAANGGAATVVGVDHSEIVYQAMDIVRANQLENVVTLIKGRMEDTTLPVESVDIIVSEWMGYFLLFESMLNTVLYARDKYLKSDGVLLPNRCTISLAGISDVENYEKVISFWDDVYGFKMSLFKDEVVREASIETVTKEKLITTPFLVHDLNLMTCTSADTQFVSSFKLEALRSGPLTAIAGWFDTFFDLTHQVAFSTSPEAPATHWKQTIFYLREPYHLTKGSVIDGKMSCTRLMKDPRALKIRLAFADQHYIYLLR